MKRNSVALVVLAGARGALAVTICGHWPSICNGTWNGGTTLILNYHQLFQSPTHLAEPLEQPALRTLPTEIGRLTQISVPLEQSDQRHGAYRDWLRPCGGSANTTSWASTAIFQRHASHRAQPDQPDILLAHDHAVPRRWRLVSSICSGLFELPGADPPSEVQSPPRTHQLLATVATAVASPPLLRQHASLV